MYGKTAAVLLSGLLFACAPAQPPAPAPLPPPPVPAAAAPPAPGDRFVNIRSVSCERFLSLAPEDRAAAAMFYIGYEASRFGARDINVPRIPSIETLALNYCSAFPQRPAAAAFADAFRATRGR